LDDFVKLHNMIAKE